MHLRWFSVVFHIYLLMLGTVGCGPPARLKEASSLPETQLAKVYYELGVQLNKVDGKTRQEAFGLSFFPSYYIMPPGSHKFEVGFSDTDSSGYYSINSTSDITLWADLLPGDSICLRSGKNEQTRAWNPYITQGSCRNPK